MFVRENVRKKLTLSINARALSQLDLVIESLTDFQKGILNRRLRRDLSNRSR